MGPYHSTASLDDKGPSFGDTLIGIWAKHGMAAQEEVVVDGGQEDAAVVWANRTSLPVSNSPAQDISQSHVTRGECAGG